MLSEENIEKLNFNGVYKCNPDIEYRGRLFENNLYHCCNWIFEVKKSQDGAFFMRDTYWSSGDSVHIRLTDENICMFEFIFDKSKVKQIDRNDTESYENVYCVAIDSGGVRYPKYFVSEGSEKSKALVLGLIDEKIDDLERQLRNLKRDRGKLERDEINPEWVGML